MFFSKTFIFLVSSFTFINAYSQTNYTLQQCIAIAQKNNLDILQTAYTTQNLEIAQSLAYYAQFPVVNGMFAHSLNAGKRYDPLAGRQANAIYQGQNFGVSASATLYQGGTLQMQKEKAALDLEKNSLTIANLQNQYTTSIANIYLQLVVAEENVRIQTEQQLLTQKQVERLQKLYKAGTITVDQIAAMEAQEAQEKYTGLQYAQQINTSKTDLKALMNLPLQQDLTISKPTISAYKNKRIDNAEAIYKEALLVQTGLKVWEKEQEINTLQTKIAKVSSYPQVTLSGSFGTGYSSLAIDESKINITGISVAQDISRYTASGEAIYQSSPQFIIPKMNYFKQLGQNVSPSISLQVNVPIFNGYQTKYAYQRSILSNKNTEIEIKKTELNLYKNVKNTYDLYTSSFNKLEAATKQLDSRKIAFQLVQKKYELGALTIYDYTQAKTLLTVAEQNVLQAQYEIEFYNILLTIYQKGEYK